MSFNNTIVWNIYIQVGLWIIVTIHSEFKTGFKSSAQKCFEYESNSNKLTITSDPQSSPTKKTNQTTSNDNFKVIAKDANVNV